MAVAAQPIHRTLYPNFDDDDDDDLLKPIFTNKKSRLKERNFGEPLKKFKMSKK